MPASECGEESLQQFTNADHRTRATSRRLRLSGPGQDEYFRSGWSRSPSPLTPLPSDDEDESHVVGRQQSSASNTTSPSDMPNIRSNSSKALEKETDEVFPFFDDDSIEITQRDVDSLKSSHHLNDGIINFLLRYMYCEVEHQNPSTAQDIFIYHTSFYTRLRQTGYSSVQHDTDSIDIFSKRYLIIPVHEKSPEHWYLIIVTNPSTMLSLPPECVIGRIYHSTTSQPIGYSSTNKLKPQDDLDRTFTAACIIILDSLNRDLIYDVPLHERPGNIISTYLASEAIRKLRKPLLSPPAVVQPGVPRETKTFDSGLYLIYFTRTFCFNPSHYSTLLVSKVNKPKVYVAKQRREDWGLKDNDVIPETRGELLKLVEMLNERYWELEDLEGEESEG
ncbi:hypothetical protein C8Q75DRAFT_736695 [Abortiporus biennis]|nr:hypothetical protein C8Q75DRAFT_736695 [Abortiporus biennis]